MVTEKLTTVNSLGLTKWSKSENQAKAGAFPNSVRARNENQARHLTKS